MDQDEIVVAAHRTGPVPTRKISEALAQSWQEMLQDPVSLQAIAQELNVNPEQLRPDQPPLRARQPTANMGAQEIGLEIITWAATSILLGAVTDIAKGALKNLWEKRLLPAIEQKLGHGSVGNQTRQKE